ncbi:Tumor necrosis factor receptor superfamily member 12A, partial [Ophiophagus hannah]
MLTWGVILGLLPVLLGSAQGELIAETNCPGGQSWSPDLEKCMDCSVCQRQNKNDFCSTCGDPQPTNTFNWVLVGASLGAVLLASIITGTIIYARCRRREKFTTAGETFFTCPGVPGPYTLHTQQRAVKPTVSCSHFRKQAPLGQGRPFSLPSALCY